MLRGYLRWRTIRVWLQLVLLLPFTVPLVVLVCVWWANGPPAAARDLGGMPFVVALAMFTVWVATLAYALRLSIFPDPARPTYTRLQAFGPPQELVAQIDAELNEPEAVCADTPPRPARSVWWLAGSMLLTRSWLLFVEKSCEVIPIPLGEIVWVRRRGTQRGATADYFVEVRTRRGEVQSFGLPRAEADGLLAELFRRLPWLLSGADAVMERAWQTGREQLLDAVDEQRRQVAGMNPEAIQSLVHEKLRRAETPS
jgi:hypothetical protein